MANGPTLPPQAYTREILAIAFQWLQNQPESIRKLAQSPDALVGLYLRAQRYGHTSPEADAPVTSQNFVNDLKYLAEGLKQFEGHSGGPAAAPAPAKLVYHQPMPAQEPQTQRHPSPLSNPSTQAPPAQPPPIHHQYGVAHPTAAVAAANLAPHLNANAQAMIQEVKTALNISSDVEVLNMMVALAYKNVRNLLA